ncbi:unnamed protein product [Periconia digitata]|uniref:Zn(2)-C6 fungal-type domain-containing protein n=1 Tax=Periconia digitata TaxID=1303443 RepID=A0A9W4XVH5_9PLEO|nr:unnamed protein product [Periconia digitata]
MQNRLKVRRRVLACARCRKRKLSCDGKVPSCTRCLDASVPCVGFDSSTQSEAPRSLADFLENHIRSLDNPASPTSTRIPPPRPSLAFPSPTASNDSEARPPILHANKSTYADDLVSQAMQDITPSFLGISQTTPILSCVVKGTQLPSRKGPMGSNDLDENHPKSIMNPQPSANTLERIDHKIANGLFHNYLDRVITQYPIYHRSDVTAAFNSIYYPASNPNNDSPRNRFIVSIIMAISLSTAARTQQKKANALAYTLVHQAMQYIPSVATNDISGLQAILLLTQYIFLNPEMADLWLLTGLISQAVIDLGLHHELPDEPKKRPASGLPENPGVSAYERDMRRRLFWCAWEMEVGVCSIFQRPVNLPIRNIEVAFPVEVDDVAVTRDRIDFTGRISKFTSRRICLFRLVEAEIFAVTRHGQPVPKQFNSFEHWMQDCEQRIIDWQSEIYANASANQDRGFDERWKEMKLYSDIAVPYIFVVLHRPSSLNPTPSTAQLMTAFVNAVKVAEGYWKQHNADFGRIKYVFHPCHHVFNSADIFLHALQRCKQEISELYPWKTIEQWMGCFSACFLVVAERWTVAKRCLEEYERELAGVKKEYTDFLAHKAALVPKPLTPIGEPVEGFYAYQQHGVDASSSMKCWNVFDAATTGEAANLLPPVTYNIPHDWNQEFNFNFVESPLVSLAPS